MRLHELNEGLDADQKRVGQVAGEESAKDISPVLGKEQKQHPFKGRLVGEDAVNEVAPPGMEDWIKDRKADFKKRYGDRWQEVLYATAWKRKNNEGVAEGDNEKIADRYSQDEWDAKIQRLKKLAGMGPLKTVWDPVKRVYKNVPVNQEKK